MTTDYSLELAVVEGNPPLKELDEVIIRPMVTKPSRKYQIVLAITSSLLLIGAICVGLTFYYGIGMWGNNQPVAWAFDITNFVFWIGIGHAGTLISAILFLLKAAMEKRNCTLCRSDDDLRCYVRWLVSDYSYRSPLACRIFNSIP